MTDGKRRSKNVETGNVGIIQLSLKQGASEDGPLNIRAHNRPAGIRSRRSAFPLSQSSTIAGPPERRITAVVWWPAFP